MSCKYMSETTQLRTWPQLADIFEGQMSVTRCCTIFVGGEAKWLQLVVPDN